MHNCPCSSVYNLVLIIVIVIIDANVKAVESNGRLPKGCDLPSITLGVSSLLAAEDQESKMNATATRDLCFAYFVGAQ